MNKIEIVLLGFLGLVSEATVSAGEGILGGIEDVKDGTAGAKVGTVIYNTFINPDDPLPMPTSDSALIENTFYNMGENLGKTGHLNPGDALWRAEMDVSGVKQIKPVKPPVIPNGGGIVKSKASPTCNCDIAH